MSKQLQRNNVTDVEESRALIAAGKDIYTAGWYWLRGSFPADNQWYLIPVPMAEKQQELDECDRFFRIYRNDIRNGLIVPAWKKTGRKSKK